MRISLLIIFLVICFNIHGQVDSIFIPKSDLTGLKTPTKHMFVGEKNNIYIPPDFTKIESNGKIDSVVINEGELPDYYVIPVKEGVVYVKATIKRNNNTEYTTISYFTAILTPPIVSKIDELELKNKVVKFIFIDSTTNKEMSKRYQLGWFIPDIKIFDSNGNQVAVISTFDFTDNDNNYKKYLIKDNIILVPSIAIRDNKTDLIYWTKEYQYKIK